MSETLFAFDERNYHECQTAFRGQNNQEYYLGDYAIEAGGPIDVRAERKAVGASSIISLRSGCRLNFRRSWAHIREDATDVTVLWFVKRGSVNITHQRGETKANAGEFFLTRSMTPFNMACLPDDDEGLEVLHIVLPSHRFKTYLAEEVSPGFVASTSVREFMVAEHIINDVFEDDDELSSSSEELLLNSALTVIAEGIRGSENGVQTRLTLAEQRLQEVLRFVEIHLADPKLSAVMVAEACDISQRYLSHLLRGQGTSFSNLVWDSRLEVAHKWLSTSRPSEISIAEIAFRVGFKSPAHFSRLFKRVYGMSPREFRASRGEASQTQETLIDNFVADLPEAVH